MDMEVLVAKVGLVVVVVAVEVFGTKGRQEAAQLEVQLGETLAREVRACVSNQTPATSSTNARHPPLQRENEPKRNNCSIN